MSRPTALARAVVITIPAGLAALLVAVRWSNAPLWRDEFATSMYASLSPGRLLEATSHVDGVLAPYYLLVHALAPLAGLGEGMRWASAFGFVATSALVGILGQRWFGTVSGLFAGSAFAIGAAGIASGANARPYALSILAVAVAILALDTTRTARSPAAGWIVYSAAGVVAVILQPLAALPLALTVILSVSAPRARNAAIWAAVSIPWFVATLLMILRGLGQRGQLDWLSRVDARDAVQTLAAALSLSPGRAVAFDAVVLAVFLAVGLLTLVRGTRSWRRPLLFALALAVAPTALLFAMSVTIRPLLAERYVLWSSIGAALVIGAAVGRLAVEHRLWDVVGACAAIVLLIVGGARGAESALYPLRGDDFPAIASDIRSSAQPGDLLVVVQRYEQGGVAYGFAEASGDRGYRREILQTVPDGPLPVLGVRRIESVDPLRTSPVASKDATDPSRTMWIVSIWPPTLEDRSGLDPAIAACVSHATPSTGRLIHGSWLFRVPCPG
ncbi:hypothetical protein [Microbacterium candidum]|uniref:Glycosyltransferase RgtA/B/C/D-like domain-containing protein n=1 Tax=Microbacterium candidum TaxID=3041922 RepID=A0ABT7MV11_9MICO|nr:hypothetical protein [Microbacterium sp. ASV49]MDL9978287.1 hypothetical protein [Microbacterium sp. ASV49]